MELLERSITEIIESINHKDTTAYEYLYKRYYAALCSYVARLLSPLQTEVEDLVQEVFLAIYENDHQFIDGRELTNYLYKACYNRCLTYLRDHRLHTEILASIADAQTEVQDDDSIYSLTIREEMIRQLYIYINELPAEQRRIMMLRIEGHDWNEIAKMLGISINTVKTQKARSYKFLREHIKDSQFSVLLLLL
jgi:RNA polymerase sigma-70 factor (ECF subfamily)